MRNIQTPRPLRRELCNYVCMCVCVGERGLDATPSGFCKWREKGLDATPLRFCKFWKGDLLYAVDALLAEILMRQLFPKFDILNIIALVSNKKLQN